MNQSLFKNLFVGFAVLLGVGAFASADPLLQPGYAVHTFGMSPDTNDANYTIRIYDTTARDYASDRPVADINDAITNDSWTIDKIGNVFGIAIDKERNIYVGASANWSSGYVGEGDTDGTVVVQYGSLDQSDRNDNSGVIYKLRSDSGDAGIFSELPQTKTTITNEVCEGTDNDIVRQTGPGLGNIAYDKIHDQLFVSNFSDGKIYRLNMNGSVLDSFDPSYQDIELNGLQSDNKTVKAPYGLAVSPDGTKLYYGTIETNYYPKLFAVELTNEGDFTQNIINQDAKLVENIRYTQNIGGDTVDDGTWAAYSDLDFTPDGELLVGVRVGCNDNFATSYNHGGVVYLLKKDGEGKYNLASDKTTPTEEQNTTYTGVPETNDDPEIRAGRSSGSYKFDEGAIPLHPYTDNDEDKIKRGPDDGYGGVAVWQYTGGFDLYATSADIQEREGVHGFMQFDGKFNITEYATVEEVKAYKSVSSSTDDSGVQDAPHDYKGIGGDVEVLSVVPMCIGSYVWEDTNKDGQQDTDEPKLCGVDVKLISADTNASVVDIDGNPVDETSTSCDDDKEGTYKFCNLPEGRYRVCVATPEGREDYIFGPTPKQTTDDNNDSELDSNIAFVKEDGFNCSGIYDLWANTEPVEEKGAPGDDQDDNADKLGNMTVDFGFVKKVFDLALIKKVVGDKTIYKPGEDVNFTITVINQGDIDAQNVLINDIVPEGLEFVDQAQWEQDRNISEIKAGENVTITVTFRIQEDFQGDSIVNVAEIESAENDYDLNDTDSIPGDKQCDNNNHDLDNDNDQADTDGCDDLDPAPITIEQHFDLALVKFVKDPKESYDPGDEVTFTIGIGNQGTITATDIQIRDIIPEGLELSDDRWRLDGDEAVLRTPIASLEPDADTTVDITFTIREDFSGTEIVNIAEIKSAENELGLEDNDSVPGDNVCDNDDDNNPLYADSGCDDEDPAAITVNKFTVSSSPDAVDSDCDCAEVESNTVNALNVWGLMLMVLWSLSVGLFVMRSRKYI